METYWAGVTLSPLANASGQSHFAVEDHGLVGLLLHRVDRGAGDADARHVEHHRILLAGDVSTEDSAFDLGEQGHIDNRAAKANPFITCGLSRFDAAQAFCLYHPDGDRDPFHLRSDAGRQVGEEAVRAEDHEGFGKSVSSMQDSQAGSPFICRAGEAELLQIAVQRPDLRAQHPDDQLGAKADAKQQHIRRHIARQFWQRATR